MRTRLLSGLAAIVLLAGCATRPSAPIAGLGQSLEADVDRLGAQIRSNQPGSLVLLERAEQGQAAAAFSEFGTGYNIVVVNQGAESVAFGPGSMTVTSEGRTHPLLTSERIAAIKLHQQHMAQVGMVLGIVGMIASAGSAVPNAALMQSNFASSAMRDAADAQRLGAERVEMTSAFIDVELVDGTVAPLEQFGGYFVASDVRINKDVNIVVHVGEDTHEFQFRAARGE